MVKQLIMICSALVAEYICQGGWGRCTCAGA